MKTALLSLASLFAVLPVQAGPLPVKSYGQELVDRVLAKERGLLVVVMHVGSPAAPDYPIVASNIGRIGKVADDDDLRVITTATTNLEVAHGATRFEVEMPMYGVSGKVVGALGIVFPYAKGANRAALQERALAIRDFIARRTLDAASLAEPHPSDPLATTATHAQKLVEAALAKDPGIDLLAVRATSPRSGKYSIVASSFGRIGSVAEPPPEGRLRAGPLADGKRYEAELPLLDAKGGLLGTVAVGWALRKGADERAALARAEKIRDAFRVESVEKLFELDP